LPKEQAPIKDVNQTSLEDKIFSALEGNSPDKPNPRFPKDLVNHEKKTEKRNRQGEWIFSLRPLSYKSRRGRARARLKRLWIITKESHGMLEESPIKILEIKSGRK
jgi:hypothetical protein